MTASAGLTRGFVQPDKSEKGARSPWDLPLAAAICVIVSMVAMGLVSRVYSDVHADREQVFLDEKLETLQTELRTIAQGLSSIERIHEWDDSGDLVPSLSLQRHMGDWLKPADPFSGNEAIGNQWLYARSLLIEHHVGPGRETLRLATTTLYRFEKGRGYVLVREGRQLLAAGPAWQETARVMDVYVLAIQNSPMVWADPVTVRSRLSSCLLDLEARNPEIRFRTHWITKLAFGRDPWYRPAQDRRMVSAVNDHARFEEDDDALRYSLADSNNHALRLAQERTLFESRVKAGLEDSEEPSWRLLLEDMHSQPERFRDAILLNLHGSTLPLPPIRNGSDAAKIPDVEADLRVVSHPEQIWFDDGRITGETQDVRLRVHAWRCEPSATSRGQGPADHRPIVLRLPGLDLKPEHGDSRSGLKIEFLSGGQDLGGGFEEYAPFAQASAWAGNAGEPGYEIDYVPASEGEPGYTELRLHGTPYSCPLVGGRGLSKSDWLHGLEYIPSPVGPSGAFTRDLSSMGNGPKNTARWRIHIPASLIRTQMKGRDCLEIQTSIGDPVPGDTLNRSLTWAWWSSDPESVPITERFQFMGDPRHNPYADLGDAGDSHPSGYNWYFDDLRHLDRDLRKDWALLDSAKLADGWMGRIDVDVPRFFLVLRESLRRSRALFVQGPGPLAFSVSLGGEQGDMPPPLLEAKDGSWAARPWLGELYPDSYIGQWRREGRLPGADFVALSRASRHPESGPRFSSKSRQAGFEGATSLLNSGEEWATFHHQRGTTCTSIWSTEGKSLVDRWSLEPWTMVEVPMPFRLRTSWHGVVGPEWPWQAMYPRQDLRLQRPFLRHSRGALGLALVSARQPGESGEGRFLLNGFGPDLEFDRGVDLLLSAAVDSILTAWELQDQLMPLPKIVNASFESASQIQILFDLAWPAQDGSSIPARLEPLEERVRYRCLYSFDGGRTYRRSSDAAMATPDRPSSDPKEWIPDSQIGPETHRFEVEPNRDGEWVIRVEAWLEGRKLHHAYHQKRLFNGM